MIARTLKRIVLAVWRSKLYGWALLAHDRLAAMGVGQANADRREVLIVAPSGRGNIGDQAMFDALLSNTPGKLYVVLGSHNALHVALEFRDRVETAVLPRLIRGHLLVRSRDVRRFAALLSRTSVLLVPGADTIDGGHPHASLARHNLAHLAADRGVRVAIQGFSWAADAPPSVAASMKRLASTVGVYPRDPVSKRRLESSGVSRLTEASDLVFSYHSLEPLPQNLESVVSAAEVAGRRLVLLNISGMIARRMDLQREYRAVVQHLHTNDCVVVFLPHVVRTGDDDLTQARDLFAAVGGPEDVLVEETLRPAQIKSLASRAFCTITGRMHLAIMSLSHGTPAITLATVGKVEGLYESFELAELVVQPRAGCDSDICECIDILLTGRDAVSDRILQRLPRVQELSARNFEFLAGRSAVPVGTVE